MTDLLSRRVCCCTSRCCRRKSLTRTHTCMPHDAIISLPRYASKALLLLYKALREGGFDAMAGYAITNQHAYL